MGRAPAPTMFVVTILASGTTNIAPQASVTASSQNAQSDQTAAKAVDGYPTGFPGDSSREWATVGGTAGSWLNLKWPSAFSVNQVILYDRRNVDDHVTSGTLSFSDGSTIAVGPLDNDGAATAVKFPARTITSMKFTVDSVSAATKNVGLTEIQVAGTGPLSSSLPLDHVPSREPHRDSTSATFAFSDTESRVRFTCALDAGMLSACTSPKPTPGSPEGVPHLPE